MLAAVYMLWIFQRTMTGPVRGFGVLGGAHSGDDSATSALGRPAGGGRSRSAPPGRRRDRRRPAPHRAALADRTTPRRRPRARMHRPRIRAKFGDLTAREITVLTPLVVLIIVLGVYPQPVLDVINPTAERTMVDVGQSDPPPAIDAPIVGGN